MTVFDADQFKNLLPFSDITMQFSYTAITKDNKTVSGFISAVSADDATKTLQNAGLAVTHMEQAEIGRNNPFIPYYDDVSVYAPPETAAKSAASSAKTTTKK